MVVSLKDSSGRFTEELEDTLLIAQFGATVDRRAFDLAPIVTDIASRATTS
jgi:hypothetical protein